MGTLGTGILMGIGATVLMDIWAVTLNRMAGVALPNWAMVGRWFAHLPQGKLFHDAIGDADPVPGEATIGWAAHYGVGVLYGVVFVLIAGGGWLTSPTLLPAWIFSIITVGAGWFLLQPGMGLGWAASKTPSPWTVRGLNLAGHTVFGLGMWGVALALS